MRQLYVVDSIQKMSAKFISKICHRDIIAILMNARSEVRCAGRRTEKEVMLLYQPELVRGNATRRDLSTGAQVAR
jgi:hypothetical protein